MVGLASIYSSCNPCYHFGRLGVSYSRWCPDECDSACDCNCETSAYAYLTQLEPFTVGANTPVPFTGPGVLSDNIGRTDGLLTLPGPGVYHVRYQVHVPAFAPVDTFFVLRLDGSDIAGTLRPAPAGVAGVTAEAIIEVCDTATLGLFSTSTTSLPVSGEGIALATLTVVEL